MSGAEAKDEDVNRKHVLILGLDGATFKVIEPLAESGRLPTFARLMDEGVWGVLDSTIPPVTIPAWVSMMTGKNPGRLGMYDLVKRDGYGVEPNGYCFANNAPIWKTLNRYGVSTGVMNIPGTYPPEEVDGFMVTGMLTPSTDSPFVYPSKLERDFGPTGLDYEIDIPQWQYFDEGVFVKDVLKVTEKRGRAAEYLFEHVPCDFHMVVFTSSDRLQHVLWNKRDVVEEYWMELDRVIGRLLEAIGEETTVFVVSDHGFGPLEKTFFVNEWLRRKGFLKAKRKITQRALLRLGQAAEGLYRFLRERKVLKYVANFLYNVVGLKRLQKYTLAFLSNTRIEGRVNWQKTKAFSCVHTPHFGQIYLNLEGEMREGCVTEEEQDEVLEAIMEELRELKDPRTGSKIKVEAHYSRDIYAGPHIDEAPEIVFILDDGHCEIDAKVGEERLFVKGAPLTGFKGTHTIDGVFIAHGPGIKRGFKIENATIMDVAPTLLHLYGVPLDDDIDGRVLDEIFEEGAAFREMEALEEEKIEGEEPSGFDEEEKALIEERLRKLGYIS